MAMSIHPNDVAMSLLRPGVTTIPPTTSPARLTHCDIFHLDCPLVVLSIVVGLQTLLALRPIFIPGNGDQKDSSHKIHDVMGSDFMSTMWASVCVCNCDVVCLHVEVHGKPEERDEREMPISSHFPSKWFISC